MEKEVIIRTVDALKKCLQRDDFLFTIVAIKYNKLIERKTIFTSLANGGAPAGHNCPSKTIELSTNSTIRKILFIMFTAFFLTDY